MIKKYALLFATTIGLCISLQAQVSTFDDIRYWVGSGENQAALVIGWNDGKTPDRLVWGYRWDGTATGLDMLEAITSTDPRLTILLQNISTGKIVGGIGYLTDGDIDLQFDLEDAQENHTIRSNDFDFKVLDTASRQLCLPFDPQGDIERALEESDFSGIVRHPFDKLYGIPSYDFDSWTSDNLAAHWGAGWKVGSIDYYTRDDASSDFQASMIEPAQRQLQNGSWDGYSFTADKSTGLSDMGDNSDFTAVDFPDIGYTTGVFVLNEDWYGHQNSTINYFTDSATWTYRIFQSENPGHELGCTSQYGTIYGNHFYIMSKQNKDPGATITGSRLAVCDARTMKVEKEFPYITSSTDGETTTSLADGRAFLGVDTHTGYVGSSNGIYLYDMDEMSIGEQIEGTGNASGSLYEDQIGSMVRVGQYVFAVHQQKGILIIDATNHIVVGTIEGAFNSIIPARDGNLWISGDENKLIRLNPYTFDLTTFEVPTPLPDSWMAWTADAFCASYVENKIYWAYSNTDDWYQDLIYCFDIDTESSDITYDLSNYDDGGWTIYHAGFRFQPVTDDIYMIVFRSVTNQRYRMLKLSKDENNIWNVCGEYDLNRNYWFPALIIFPDNALPVVEASFPEEITLSKDDRRYAVYLGDKVSDEDNFACTIVKSVASADDAVLMNAYVANDSLIVELCEGTGNFNTIITTAFNSNGKTVYKRTRISATGISGNIKEAMDNTATIALCYPNPASDNVHFNYDGKAGIEIFDTNGHLLITQQVNAGEMLDIQSLTKGNYILRMTTAAGIFAQHLIKQ